jgi:transcriptional regulator with XRE-family HTH domain
MIPGGGNPATPLQVAMFGHVAAAIRQAMAAKGWKPADLNRAIGRPRAHAGVYSYIAGKGSPVPKTRALIAKALGIPEAALIMRRVDGPQVEVEAAPVLRIEGPHRTPQAGPTRHVLQFEVDGEGLARIRLDVSLPSADAVPLLRMLLDAGLVLGTPRP